jgi:hypothetical protein
VTFWWAALPNTVGLAYAWSGRSGHWNGDSQFAQPPDMVSDQALLLPLVERRRGPVLKRLVGLQHLIDQQQQSVRDRDEGGSFLPTRFAGDSPELFL